MNDMIQLRYLIREIIESELEEFSSGGVVGGSAPLGDTMHHMTFPDERVSAGSKKRKNKKRKKVDEAASVSMFEAIPQTLYGDQVDSYADSIDALCASFGGSENPFGKSIPERDRNAKKFLLGRP
jgi:hypothetical protein